VGSGRCSGSRLVLAAFLWGVTALAAIAQDCALDKVDVRGPDGTASFTVEIADTVQERALGLMYREDKAADHGMLFLYDRPQRLAFWMRNTLIELDMIFVRPDGTVARVHDRAQPQDDTAIDGGPGLVAVLEINGGLAEELGIVEGSELRHPFFGRGAAWPC
jgi:uncharacterized membrane protein (UPF0127 family)